MRSTLLLAVLCAAPATAQGVRLGDLPALAAARAERQRPAQLAALEPFLHDLQLDYARSKDVVDEAVAKTAALGDGIVPLLLERLTPAAATPKDLHLAANVARVLAQLEPDTFTESLIDIARGEDPVARRHAIRLLGLSDDPRARETVAAIYSRLTEPGDQLLALRAAERQGSPLLASVAIAMVADADRDRREHALRYLTTIADPAARDAVIAAFREEKDERLLDAYLDYFVAVARQDAAVADALCSAIEKERLDGDRLLRAVEGLRTIAPEEHKEARRVLRNLLDRGDPGPLGVATALTLDHLGDKRAERTLFDQQEERVKRRRSDPDVYVDRAEAYMAFERWREAIRDLELAIRYTQSQTRRGFYFLQMARCEAHRDSTTRMLRALEDSELGAETIRREAAKDPIFAEALQKDVVDRFLKRLDR